MTRRILLLGVMTAWMVARAEVQQPVLLWPAGAPGAVGVEDKDKPSLTPFLPNSSLASGSAIVVCPGGGYGGLADHEGKDYAEWLNQQGVAAFVLKYRLGSQGYRHPRMLEDAARAVRFVRSKANQWGIDAERIGIMGSSAGGHLASTLLTHFDGGDPTAADPIDRVSSRPALGILCYPVVTMGVFTHQGSRNNLLGEDPSADLIWLLSNELQVTPKTPPTFLWHTVEDTAVPIENTLQFASALRKVGVAFDLHVYEKGRHGIGLADKAPYQNVHPWAKDCVFWLKQRGFLK